MNEYEKLCNEYRENKRLIEDLQAETGLYKSRYFANKAKCADEIAVKVDGGYKIMTYSAYYIWRNQK